MKKILLGTLVILTSVVMSGCGAAGYSVLPSSKKGVDKDTIVKTDKFEGATIVQTEKYLIRKGFTDTFPVILGFKASIKDDKLDNIKIMLEINDTVNRNYNRAVGVDQYKFSFKTIAANNDVASITSSNTNIVGRTAYTTTNTMNIKKNIVDMYLTYEQLKQIAKKNYSIKIYGATKEGVFEIPQYLTQSFVEKLNTTIK